MGSDATVWFGLPNEIHGFLLEANRVQWYETLVAFFEKNLAPRTKPASP